MDKNIQDAVIVEEGTDAGQQVAVAAVETPADEAAQQGDSQGETSVPKARFDEVNNEMKALKDRVELMEQNNALAAANAPEAPQGQGPAGFDIFKEVGVPDDPNAMVTVDQQRKINEYNTKVFNAQLADLRFHVEHPEFTELVGTSEQISSGQFATPLASAIKENPALLPTILQSRNPKLAAFKVAKAAQSKAAAAKINPDPAAIIDQAVTNAGRVKSSSTVKGGSALPAEGRFLSMDDAAFVELARKNGANL